MAIQAYSDTTGVSRNPKAGATLQTSKPEKPTTQSSDSKYKIQISLNDRQKDRLFQLKEETGVDSAAQVVREALRVYEFLVDELIDGSKELYIIDDDQNSCRIKLL